MQIYRNHQQWDSKRAAAALYCLQYWHADSRTTS